MVGSKNRWPIDSTTPPDLGWELEPEPERKLELDLERKLDLELEWGRLDLDLESWNGGDSQRQTAR